MNTRSANAASGSIPWWRVPQMWLVVGGPLVVVVASLITTAIAVTHPDPVLDKEALAADRQRVLSARTLTEATPTELTALQPAQVARNHAAAPLPVTPPGAGK